MSFRIRNEFFPLKVVLAVASVLWFISVMSLSLFKGVIELWGIAIGICIGLAALIVISLILFFIDKAMGAVITVDDRSVMIRQMFGKRKIALEDIEELDFEDYSRRVKRHKEYRIKMAIICSGGKKITLTDNASRINGLLGFVTGEREEIPYSDIPLYQAGKYIEEVTGS